MIVGAGKRKRFVTSSNVGFRMGGKATDALRVSMPDFLQRVLFSLRFRDAVRLRSNTYKAPDPPSKQRADAYART